MINLPISTEMQAVIRDLESKGYCVAVFRVFEDFEGFGPIWRIEISKSRRVTYVDSREEHLEDNFWKMYEAFALEGLEKLV